MALTFPHNTECAYCRAPFIANGPMDHTCVCGGRTSVTNDESLGTKSPEEALAERNKLAAEQATRDAIQAFINRVLGHGGMHAPLSLRVVVGLAVLAIAAGREATFSFVKELWAVLHGTANWFGNTIKIVSTKAAEIGWLYIMRVAAFPLLVILYYGLPILVCFLIAGPAAKSWVMAPAWTILIFNLLFLTGIAFTILAARLNGFLRLPWWGWALIAAGVFLLKAIVLAWAFPYFMGYWLAVAILTAAWLYPAPPLQKIFIAGAGTTIAIIALVLMSWSLAQQAPIAQTAYARWVRSWHHATEGQANLDGARRDARAYDAQASSREAVNNQVYRVKTDAWTWDGKTLKQGSLVRGYLPSIKEDGRQKQYLEVEAWKVNGYARHANIGRMWKSDLVEVSDDELGAQPVPAAQPQPASPPAIATPPAPTTPATVRVTVQPTTKDGQQVCDMMYVDGDYAAFRAIGHDLSLVSTTEGLVPLPADKTINKVVRNPNLRPGTRICYYFVNSTGSPVDLLLEKL